LAEGDPDPEGDDERDPDQDPVARGAASRAAAVANLSRSGMLLGRHGS
jgi:hypothetical protein